LGFHRILIGTEKRFNAEMLLDPFEKQLNLPAAPVKLRDDQGRKLGDRSSQSSP
jgi:hypothetical protein